MKTGDVIRVRSIKSEHYDDDGKWVASATFRAPKGTTFELILLGHAPFATPLDPNDWLGEMGWARVPEENAVADLPADPSRDVVGQASV